MLSLLLLPIAVTAGQSADLFIRRTIEVTATSAPARGQIVSMPLDDLSLPPEIRLETLRLIDPDAHERVDFEFDEDRRILTWLADLPPNTSKRLEVHVSSDTYLTSLGPSHFPKTVRTGGTKEAGQLIYELTGPTDHGELRVALQDGPPYMHDIANTHTQPPTESDQEWRERLWCRRIGVQSFAFAGRDAVPGHWPGYWTGLSYYHNDHPFGFSRADSVSVRRGCLVSSLSISGETENFVYSWGRGLEVRLDAELHPGGQLHVRWTLSASGEPEAEPVTDGSVGPLHFFPEFVAPIFDRAIWHDAAGTLHRADVSLAADTAFCGERPGGEAWCALYDSEGGLLFGLAPDEWGDGGNVHLAAHDGDGWPSSVLVMQMVGLPAGDWQPGEEHVWSYWLVTDEARDEDEAARIMSSVSRTQDARMTVRVLE